MEPTRLRWHDGRIVLWKAGAGQQVRQVRLEPDPLRLRVAGPAKAGRYDCYYDRGPGSFNALDLRSLTLWIAPALL